MTPPATIHKDICIVPHAIAKMGLNRMMNYKILISVLSGCERGVQIDLMVTATTTTMTTGENVFDGLCCFFIEAGIRKSVACPRLRPALMLPTWRR